jgi:hypothetical protein
MTRCVFFAALLSLSLAFRPLTASDQLEWITDQEVPTRPVLTSEFDDPADALKAADRNDLPANQAVYNSLTLEPPGAADETSSTAVISDAGCSDLPLYPVCDCGCSIPCLDHWNVCDTPCCVTDPRVWYPYQCPHGNCYLSENDGGWVSNDTRCDVWGPPVDQSTAAVRFGWWGIHNEGSQNKTGEYQDLQPSPFWDVDAISSNGVRTVDISLTGLDKEAPNDVRMNYFGPEASAKVEYQRYLRRLDHDPLAGYDLDNPVPPGPDDHVVTEDLNVGEDYAIRVQELDAKFQGRLTDNLKWRLNLWGQRKFGDRQANAVAHCFNINAPDPAGASGNKCHVLSQSQSIDWLTMEIQPVVEAEFENVTVEYSRTMRSFGHDDQSVDRMYTRFGFSPASGTLGPDYEYAIVPDNFTQIDRLKIGATLNDCNRFYGNLFNGDTKNKFRDTRRTFDGFDLRLINTAIDNVDLTGYASRYDEDNELPTIFLNAPPLSPANNYDQNSLRHPLDYTRTRAGLKGKWEPFGDRRSCHPCYGFWHGTSLAAGYEYYLLERDFAVYNTTPVPFEQPDTITHQIEFGPTTRWSRRLETFTRYKVQFIHVPLIGVSEYSEEDVDIQGTFNSSLPEQVHSVELGGTWTLADNLLATAQFNIVNSWQDSQYANFTENDYPMVFTVWYAPSPRLSLTSGYAYYSNWIDQDITLGANRGVPADTSTTRWNYAGENHLVNFNASYAWSECVQLIAGYEWDRGSNIFGLPALQDGADWSLLPSLSDVIVETNRVTAGMDWQPYKNMNLYLRYILFDYDDISSGLNSGTTHMVLAGATRTW